MADKRQADDDLLTEARKRWQACAAAEDAQRKRIVAAKKFRALDQWPTAIKIAREGGGSLQGLAPQPARPCLVVDRLSQPVRQVSNTIKNADFGFDVLPNGSGATQETADILKGYLRRVQNQSRGESPVEWAADGAIEGGIGWFRLRTEYVHESWDGAEDDPEAYDQELRLERITNNLTVYCDPSATKPTRSDARYMFVTQDLEKDDFTSRYPKADVKGLEEFMTTGDLQGWVSEDTIRIAEYWRVTYETKTIRAGDKTRTVRTPVVRGAKITAVEVLESWDWVGSRIPLIPVLGEELNLDGQCVLRGIIEMGMDAQRMVNYTYSAGMEIFALGSKAPYVVAAESVANYKAFWDTANTINYSYLPFDEYVDGKQYTRPQRDQAEAPIQAAVLLMRTSEEAIKASTSTGDASLGNTNPNERSGRALQALQQQSDLANSNYPDNVRRALIYAAELMVEMIPKITRPGQIVHILGMDDEPDQVMVGQPFAKGPDGIPQAAPPDVTPEMAQLQQSLYSFYDPTKGRYATTVTLGKASATRREEGAMALGDLIPHLPPEMAAVATPDYVRQLSFPGAQKIAERLEQALPPALQPKQDGQQAPDPHQLQAQLQQLQGALQQAQQQLQTDGVKAQVTMQKAQLDGQVTLQAEQLKAQLEIELQKMKGAVAIEVARIAASKAVLDPAAAAAEERLATGLQQSHELGMQAHAQAHEQQMAEADRQQERERTAAEQSHEAALAAQGQQAQAEQQETAHAQSLEAQQQAAALAPSEGA